MYVRDTIAAISTPLGEGGSASSGSADPRQSGLLRKFSGRNGTVALRATVALYYGAIIDPGAGNPLDDNGGPDAGTRLLYARGRPGAPVSRRCPGGAEGSGSRPSERCPPGRTGRVTKHALNGRIDLVQAEAVIDVIRAGARGGPGARSPDQREGPALPACGRTGN